MDGVFEGLPPTKEEEPEFSAEPEPYEVVDWDRYFDENGTFDHMLFTRDMLTEYRFKTTKDNETVYVYNGDKGIYEPTGEQFIKRKMATRLKEKNKHHYYTDIIHHIKGLTYFERPRATNPDKLVLHNGILNIQTEELQEFSPQEFRVTQIPVTYDPKSTCPRIMKFLTEVVGETQLPLVQEMFGYCLYQAYSLHKAFMFVGNGKNGKSTLQKLLAVFLGKDNVSHQTLQDILNNRFSKAELEGKLANTCADIPDTALIHTGAFKMLTGDDPISAERKFKNPFSFTNYAKLVFSCNKVPETKDETDAFFRRWIIITCNRVFSGDKCDPKILRKITTAEELAGLLNWALEGLRRLLELGRFSTSEDFEEQRKQYIRKSNSAKSFIEECLQYDPNAAAVIPEAELYQDYIQFCDQNQLPTSKKAILTQNIHQYLPQAKQTTSRIQGKITHVWQHIRFVTTVTGDYTKEEKQLSNFLNLSGRVVTPVTNSSALTFDDLKAVYWAEGQFSKKLCCVCEHERETCWIAETFKGEQKPLCEDCVQAYDKERAEP